MAKAFLITYEEKVMHTVEVVLDDAEGLAAGGTPTEELMDKLQSGEVDWRAESQDDIHEIIPLGDTE